MSPGLSLDNAVFSSYAFYATVVILKMFAVTVITAKRRFAKGVFANPEDISKRKGQRVDFTDQDVERARRNHLNDLENIPAFLVLGLLYVLTNPTLTVAVWHFRVFAAARILHMIAYQLPLPQPSRALSFGTGFAVCVSMAAQIIRATL